MEQLDLFPDTVVTAEKRLDNRIDLLMSMWRGDRRVATLAHLKLVIDERINLEARNPA